MQWTIIAGNTAAEIDLLSDLWPPVSSQLHGYLEQDSGIQFRADH